jgi:hypothetical protein
MRIGDSGRAGAEENARMRREIASGGGDLYRPTDKAKDIARV